MTLVTKRDNTLTELDINKIKKVIELATKDLDVNPLELESSLTTALIDKVSTRTIQDNLITNAVNFTTIEYPDWRYVAGRLLMMNIWKETVLKRGYRFNSDSFYDHIVSMVNKNLYDQKLLDIYTKQELEEVGKYINYERDLDYDYAGASLLQNRYLIEGELPQEMYMTICLLLASVESKDKRISYAKQFYDLVSKRKISLATPILLNLRKPNGNLSSCFVLGINDTIESIFDNIKNLALISKNGGGAGVYLSKIRATGSSIRNIPNTSGGVLPWIKIINDTAIAVDQGGKRAGAITVALDIWHLDIEDFLECQTENGDQRKKSYDIFPQVVIPDYFFKILEEDRDWYLFDPHEIRTKFNIELTDLLLDQFIYHYIDLCNKAEEGRIKLYKKVKAKELLKHIINTQLETGLPYLFFKDTWNKYNPNKDTGTIYCTNLCVAPETLVLTDKGNIPIRELVNQTVNVWNGFEWSEVIVRKTGENQKLYKVTLIDDFDRVKELYCTEYHKWYMQDINSAKEVTTLNLIEGEQSITYKLPSEYNAHVLDIMHFIVDKIEDLNRYDDTYCFSEPKRHYGVFNGILTGQCIESSSNFKADELIHVCNLVSINYANVSWNDLKTVCEASVRILDNTIDLTTEPVTEASRHNSAYRVIGVGSMGLADFLALNRKNYNTGKELVNQLFEAQAYYCTKASADLAIERGSFALFDKSEWAKGNLIGKPLSWFKKHSSNYEQWEQLSNQIKQTGIRSSQIQAVAPNTSSSLLQGCTASILPIYSRLYFDKNSKGTVPIAPPYIKEYPWYYQEQKNVDQNIIIDLVGTAIQPWIDTGISMELVINLNANITKKDIADMIVNAWKKECKAIYYIRSIQKGIDTNCYTCAN